MSVSLPSAQRFIEEVRAVYAMTASLEDRVRRVRPLLAALLETSELREAAAKWPNLNDWANERIAQKVDPTAFQIRWSR